MSTCTPYNVAAAQILSGATGLSADCWAQSNDNKNTGEQAHAMLAASSQQQTLPLPLCNNVTPSVVFL